MLGSMFVAGLATACLMGAVFLVVAYLWPRSFFAEAREAADSVDAAPGGMMGASGNLLLRRIGEVQSRWISAPMRDRFRRRYVMAGQPGTLTAIEFIALQELSALFFLSIGWWLVKMMDFGAGWIVGFALVGAALPEMWLKDLITKRHNLITRALPYDLDLLTLSVEAGLDFTGAVAKVVEKGKPGPLRDELSLMLSQLKMGKTREEGLRNMADRVNLPSLTTFVSTLIQADRMGTPLGKVLRIQSSQLRIERTQRAEKLAGEAPVKMLFPLILCIFPCVFMVLLGPILFQLVMSSGG